MEEQKTSKQAIRQVLRDFWSEYTKKPWVTAISFILPAVGTILVFFIPPLILAKIVDTFVASGRVSLDSVSNYIILLAGLWLLGEAFWRIGMYYLIILETNSIKSLSKLSFRRLLNRGYGFYADNFVGSLTNKSSTYMSAFLTITEMLYYNIVTNMFTLLFATIVLWKYSPAIPIILLTSLVVVLCIAIPLIKRRSKLVAVRHAASSKMAGRLSDAVTNILTIKSFSKEQYESSIYTEHITDFARKYRRAGNFNNLYIDGILSPIYVATNIIGLIAAIYFASKFNLQTGAVIVVFSYYSQITRIFWEINHVYRTIESNIGGAAEFTQLFVAEPSVTDAPSAVELTVHGASIVFKDIHFDYDNNKEGNVSFLNNLNIIIPSGQKVGIVGPSGGGKTTLTKILLRFINVQSGSILIDGQDIAGITQHSLREAIAYVPQEPLLFHRSLFENIAYGDPDASETAVKHAAILARADEFISKLPEGYQTMVGERGIKLSGGQRQRIAIARALLKQSKILVLDEATSALDSESEKYIQEGLLELMKGKTALVIAHRLSTIKHLDRIIVLDKGKVVQDGTHDELVAKKNGIYAKLWNHQSGGFIEE
jgi:ATP-binding cassette subfamily B protein